MDGRVGGGAGGSAGGGMLFSYTRGFYAWLLTSVCLPLIFTRNGCSHTMQEKGASVLIWMAGWWIKYCQKHNVTRSTGFVLWNESRCSTLCFRSSLWQQYFDWLCRLNGVQTRFNSFLWLFFLTLYKLANEPKDSCTLVNEFREADQRWTLDFWPVLLAFWTPLTTWSTREAA